MLILNFKTDSAAPIDGELVLPFELREKCRFRTQLVSGEEVGIFTERGTVLRDGDLLKGDDGRIIRVVAQEEPVYRIECASLHALMRCAFHLGNRHTPTQLCNADDRSFLRIRKDQVLKEMLQGLEATVTDELAPFNPEAGAYGGGHHHNPLAPVPERTRIHRPSDVNP